jgi:hypothetical protein
MAKKGARVKRATQTQPTRKKAASRPRGKSGGAATASSAGSRASKAASGARPRGRSRPGSSTLNATAQAIGRTLGQTTAAIIDRLPWGGRSDALDLLERDHRRLEELLKSGTAARAAARRTAILGTITRELTAHELIEEKVLYPELKSHAEARDIVLEGYQEHHVADVVLKELQRLPPSDERWGAKLKVLKENIEHHIEEEEGEMFKTARTVLSRKQLQELGTRMQAMKDEALAGERSGA